MEACGWTSVATFRYGLVFAMPVATTSRVRGDRCDFASCAALMDFKMISLDGRDGRRDLDLDAFRPESVRRRAGATRQDMGKLPTPLAFRTKLCAVRR